MLSTVLSIAALGGLAGLVLALRVFVLSPEAFGPYQPDQ